MSTDAPPDATARPVPGLSRERIVKACIEIADVEGADAVTLRRLGRALGADATAVYRHFRDKDEILRAAADCLLVETLHGFRRTGAWKDDLRALAAHVRSVYLAHPGVAQLVTSAPEPLPSEGPATETGLAILRSTGLPDDEAVVAFEVVQDYLLSLTTLDAARAGGTNEAWRRQFAALPADEYPNLAAVGQQLYRDADARFQLGLDLLIEAIDARLRASAG